MKEQIKYALSLFTNDSGLRMGMASPFVLNGRVYATNGFILASLPIKDEIVNSFDEIDAKHPNAEAIFGKGIPSVWNYVDNAELNTKETFCEVAGMLVQGKNVTLIHQFGRLIGIKDWRITRYDDFKLIFSAQYMDDAIYILLMKYGGDEAPSHIVNAHFPSHFKGGNEVAWGKGRAYYNQIVEDAAKAEEEHAKANFKVYEITLAMYATMAVKANSYEEAKEIALENADSDMFEDSDIDVDSYSESTRDWASDEFDVYYDADGVQEWDNDEEEA